ncbi:unnamed protein product [Malus baccata var. baccata]
MDRDREANTRCTWFTQIGYVHGVEEFSLIVKGLHKYIGSSSPLGQGSKHKMYVVHPDWLRPRSRKVLINCEGFTQVHRFKLSFSEY